MYKEGNKEGTQNQYEQYIPLLDTLDQNKFYSLGELKGHFGSSIGDGLLKMIISIANWETNNSDKHDPLFKFISKK